jgi:antitoxin PrlF
MKGSPMPVAIEEISTITAKGQTTVPKAVRQALGVDYGGRIAFRVSGKGVTVVRADEEEDPAICEFLGFLARDIKDHPERVKAITPELAARIAALTDGMDGDPDEIIDGDVAL